MSWHKVLIPKHPVAQGHHIRLMDDFVRAFEAAGYPRNSALWAKGSAVGDETFFSPGASAIAPLVLAKWQAVPCEKPTRGTNIVDVLCLLVGHQQDWKEFE